MASTSTGQMFSQEQVDAMTVEERAKHGLVEINDDEQVLLGGMTDAQRVDWLKENKGFELDLDMNSKEFKRQRKEKLHQFRQKKQRESNRRKEKNRRKVSRQNRR